MPSVPAHAHRHGRALLLAAAALVALGAALALAPAAEAQGCSPGPPPNDCFDSPIVVGATPYTNAQDTTGATTEGGEPSPCGGIASTVWYRWTPSTSGMVTIDTAGSDYDTALAVYTGAAVGSLSNIACNDDAIGLQSEVSFSCTAGTTYQVQLGGFAGNTGNADLNIGDCAPPPPCVSGGPPNDCFDSPITVTATPYTNSQLTTGAQSEPGEPSPCGGIDATVWYTWTPTTSGVVTVDTYGSSFDTVVAAYTGATVAGLATVACNDDSPTQGCCQSEVTFGCSAGTTYRIQLGGFFGGTGSATLNIGDCAPPPPCVSGGPANDCFEDAVVVPSTPFAATQDTFGAQMEPGEPAPCAGMGSTVWYTWTAAGDGLAVVTTSNPGTDYDTALAAYTGADLFSLTTVDCNDDSPIIGCCTSYIEFGCVAGTTYHIQLGGFFGSQGTAELTIDGCEPTVVAEDDEAYPLEDEPAFFIDVLANDVSVEPLTVTAVGAATFAAAGYPAVAPGGIGVLYQPGADANGVDSFTYTVEDPNGLTATGTVTIDVTPVNDAPAFAGTAATVEAAQGGLPMVVPGWATLVTPASGILDVPPTALDEAAQGIAFATTFVSDPAIFAVGPVLERTASATSTVPSATGEFALLRFTPSASTSGTSSVCFEAQDDGGTDFGGEDTSAAVCGTVTVVPCAPQADLFQWAYRFYTFSAPAGAVFGNDAASPLQPAALVSSTAGGELDFDPATGGFTYRPSDTFTPGPDTFQYTVTCGASTSGPVTVRIDVRVNQPPVAYFRESVAASQPGQAVTFHSCPASPPDCSFDPDPDGSIVSYEWEFGDGGTSTSPLPSHVFGAPGVYQVRLTVRDNVGDAATFVRTVRVGPPDEAVATGTGGSVPPVADAGEDQEVLENSRVTLHGSQRGAAEPVFQWVQMGGPVQVELHDAESAEPWFTAPMLADGEPVTFVFALRVLDGSLMSAGDVVVVRVVSGNTPPVADAGGAQEVASGAAVTLDGNRSTDPDGQTLTYLWEQVLRDGDPAVALDDPRAESPRFTAPDGPAILLFRLRVSDGRAQAMDDAMVVVQARPAAAGPRFTYSIAPAEPGAELRAVRFEAAAGVTEATWDFGDGSPPATGTSVTHHFAPGTYRVTLRSGDASHVQDVAVSGVAAEAAAPAAAFPWLPAGLALLGLVALLGLLVALRARRGRA